MVNLKSKIPVWDYQKVVTGCIKKVVGLTGYSDKMADHLFGLKGGARWLYKWGDR